MKQEDKELLLKDLCARLPYGVKCRFETTTDTYQTIEFSREGTNGVLVDFDELHCYWFNEGYILPYLRPMSSMTEEEEREINPLLEEIYDFSFKMDELLEEITMQKTVPCTFIDWLNEHHFDYRGLIEKGLALEAPEGMYKID